MGFGFRLLFSGLFLLRLFSLGISKEENTSDTYVPTVFGLNKELWYTAHKHFLCHPERSKQSCELFAESNPTLGRATALGGRDLEWSLAVIPDLK